MEAMSAQPPTWELERLRPPSAVELLLEHRAGRDPNALLERFTGQYLAACVKDYATISEIVGDDNYGPRYRELSDQLNKIAEDRREDWWVTPLKTVARLVAGARAARAVSEQARRSLTVGFIIRTDKLVGRRQRARARCPRLEQRPRARRAGASSRTSSADPGSDQPGEPALRLAPAARAVLTFGCLTAAERGEVAA